MDLTERLFDAVYSGDMPEVRRLLIATPELARVKNGDTLSILHFAHFLGRTAALAALIAAGPPLDLFEAAALDEVSRVTQLVDETPEALSAYSPEGFTALHLASYYGAPEVVGVLLERGADTEAVTQNFLENMPIHAAAAGRHTGICALLLDHGAEVNARQHGGFVPLHAAAQHGDREMAELFLRHGADPAAATDEGKVAADIAAAQGNIELAALLRSAAAAR